MLAINKKLALKCECLRLDQSLTPAPFFSQKVDMCTFVEAFWYMSTCKIFLVD